jgi:predicted metal-dependent phosphotriesterase family hydrolase
MNSIVSINEAISYPHLYNLFCFIFQENGGTTVVENTTIGIDRDMTYMQEVSAKTGVNIVSGTGGFLDVLRAQVLVLYNILPWTNFV